MLSAEYHLFKRRNEGNQILISFWAPGALEMSNFWIFPTLMVDWNVFSGGDTALIHYGIKYPPWSIQFGLFHAENSNVSLSKHEKISFQKSCRYQGHLTSSIRFYQHWKGFLSCSWRLYQFLCIVYYQLYLQQNTNLCTYLNKMCWLCLFWLCKSQTLDFRL